MQPVTSGINGRPRALTDSQALEIVKRAKGGETRTDLAREFGVHRKVVQNILSGRGYSDVTGIVHED